MTDFRVIIVGGGIGGLTLANCLQHANIDFVVLEGREKIGLHFGSGVGIDPPAARILDQLGIFSDLESQFCGTAPTKAAVFRDISGEFLFESNGYALSEARTGYHCAFYRRPEVLQTLHKYIKDKNKVLVNKRTCNIEYRNEKPIVVCEDGSKHTGHIVVGCDGVHRAVRKEMWRLTDLNEPGKIPLSDKDFLTANYRGLYAISGPVEGLETGNIQIVAGRDEVCYWMVMKDGCVMWALVEKLDKEYHLPNIPRYTEEDARVFAESKLDKILVSDTAQVKFGDLWKKVRVSALVSVEEGDLKVWTSGKIVCLGDSVHKVTPESGIGTTIVIESVASLANHLKRLFDYSAGKSPTSANIEDCLKLFEAQRHPRASDLTRFGKGGVRLFTLANRKIRWIFKYLAPYYGGESTQTEKYIAAERVEYLPIPPRSVAGTMAFNQTQGYCEEAAQKSRAMLALPLLLLAVNAWRNPQTPTFISQLLTMPLYLIWMMEGSRRAYMMGPVQWILFFSIMSFFHGVTTFANIWFFLHYTKSPIEIFGALDQRLLQMNYAKMLLPAIVFGTIIPALTVIAYPEAEISRNLQVLWPILPIALTIIHRLLASLITDSTPFDRLYRVKADLPWLRQAVITVVLTSAALFNYLRFTGTNPVLPSEGTTQSYQMALGGVLGVELGSFLWIIFLFKDLKKARMIQTKWIMLLVGYALSSIAIGSGATLLLAWLWQEQTIATKRHWTAVTKAK